MADDRSKRVTKEHVHDGKKLIPSVKKVMRNASVGKVIADGAYDSRKNCRSHIPLQGIAVPADTTFHPSP